MGSVIGDRRSEIRSETLMKVRETLMRVSGVFLFDTRNARITGMLHALVF